MRFLKLLPVLFIIVVSTISKVSYLNVMGAKLIEVQYFP